MTKKVVQSHHKKKQKKTKRGGPKRTFEDDYITEEHQDIYIYILC